jgi:hypothetical protein
VSPLADWLVAQAPGYRHTHQVNAARSRALDAITRCRTPELGGRVYCCASCQRVDFAYHSCHHRACPRCGGDRTAAWTERQCERLLPVPYFMVTFTLPAPLRTVFAAEPKIMIDLLFAESARALQAVASMTRHLGADLGMIGVLHTWGRQMQLHPHVHFIVPGGGLRADGDKWRKSKRPDWLVPAPPVAAAFRAGMDAALRAALPAWHAQVPDLCWRQKWVIDIQHVGRGEAALKYLGRYVKRTAISDDAARPREDGRSKAQARGTAEGESGGCPQGGRPGSHRIIELGDEQVRFRYRDTATGEQKQCTLDADEFMRRYLQHVLPAGVHRVRYFGWEHPAAGRRRRIVETLLEVEITVTAQVEVVAWHLVCPHCQTQTLRYVGALPRCRAPPPRRCAA